MLRKIPAETSTTSMFPGTLCLPQWKRSETKSLTCVFRNKQQNTTTQLKIQLNGKESVNNKELLKALESM